MDIKKFDGLSQEVYTHIAPFAMDTKYIKANGNPITTSDKHLWYAIFDESDNIIAFCSLKSNDKSKHKQIGNLFVIKGGQPTFNHLVKKIISDVAAKGIALLSYANNDTKEWYSALGFGMEKKGVNWHTMRYNG